MKKSLKSILLLSVAFYAFSLNADITQAKKQVLQNLKQDIAGYRSYEEIVSELQKIEADYPNICKLYDIGDSWGKKYYNAGNSSYSNFCHDIWALKVSDNVAIEEVEPSVYFMSGHHGREPMGVEVVMAILNHIIEKYGADSDINERVDNTQIWFVPLINPNGHKLVIDEDEIMWRKNIRDNNGNGYFDSDNDGVDLDRNYGYKWGEADASSDWSDEKYHGPEAWSEPETQAIKEFIESHHFVAGINYHSYGEIVLYPYGYKHPAKAPDFKALKDLAKKIGMSIPQEIGDHYKSQPMYKDFPRSGTAEDFFYGEHGIFPFIVKLGTQYIPAADKIESICKDNIEAAMILLDRFNYAMLTGHITDAITGQPIMAEITIKDIDNTGEPRQAYQSNIKFGSYYRLLKNGEYEVTFSKEGYYPKTFTSVEIFKNSVTILDVQLMPMATSSSHGELVDKAVNDVQMIRIGSNRVNIIFPFLNNSVAINVYSTHGRLVQAFGVTNVSHNNCVIHWDVSDLTSGIYLLKLEDNNKQIFIQYILTK